MTAPCVPNEEASLRRLGLGPVSATIDKDALSRSEQVFPSSATSCYPGGRGWSKQFERDVAGLSRSRAARQRDSWVPVPSVRARRKDPRATDVVCERSP